MNIDRTNKVNVPRCFAPLLLIAVSLVLQAADAQTELSELTDEQVIEELHREDYEEEFKRRVESYSAEERESMMEILRNTEGRRRFPQDYTDDELFDLVKDSRGHRSYFKALNELKARYEAATPDEMTALAERLRHAYQATPYPVFDPENANEPAYLANGSVYNDLDTAVNALLPEELGLNLLREVYLDNGQKGAITQFLLRLRGEPFTGPATLAVLEELAAQVADYGESELNALGEHESLGGIIANRIRRCSDNSFEAIKARDWRGSDLDIYAMGNFEDPEARALLLEYYDTIPKDHLYIKSRLRVLNALIVRWDREHDFEFRKLLREELTDMLRKDYNDSLAWLMDVIRTIEESDDPYFIPLLERRRADLDLADIRRTSFMPSEYVEINIQSTLKSFDSALETLEAEQG